MSGGGVVRNYAETLLELASREEAVGEFGGWIAEVAAFYRNEPDVRNFFDTPSIDPEEKKKAIQDVFADEAPELFVRFLLVVLEQRRHGLLPEIEETYRELVDEREGRVHLTVTLPEEPEESFRQEIVASLEEILGQEVIPHFRTDEDVLGGIVVRMKDREMDGTLRRRLTDLRKQLLEEEIGTVT